MAFNMEAEIKRKAESGVALSAPTAEKQAKYNAYQSAMQKMVSDKASAGQKLSAPNAYKNQLYAEALKNPQPKYMSNDPRMRALEDMLKQGADAQYKSQEAMLGQARDKQILDLQKALEDAVVDGQISVREAESQFEEQKGAIEQQAYLDSQKTSLVSQDMGIQNSAQMIGLMQGDNARKNSLINTNMTTRDKRLADVKDRLSSIKNKTSLDITNANANYGYGLANARGQVDAQMLQNKFSLGMEDYKMNKSQEFDLAKMDKQQAQVLEQMAKSFGYDIRKMDKQQVLELAQMAKQFNYSQTLQDDAQLAQQQEGARDRMFREKMFGMEQSAKLAEYDLALERELASYDTGTPEGKLRVKQLEEAQKALMLESQSKLMADVMGKSFADTIGNPPIHPGSGASKKEIEAYNNQVKAYNSKLDGYMKNPGNLETFFNGLEEIETPHSKLDTFKKALNKGFSGALGKFVADLVKGSTP